MQDAVREGMKVLKRVSTYAWAGFIMFIVLEVVYFHRNIVSGLKSLGLTFRWLFTGCKFDEKIETRFDTPRWKM